MTNDFHVSENRAFINEQLSFVVFTDWQQMSIGPNVTIIYIIGGSPCLVSSPESIRRVGGFRFVIKTVTIYLRRGMNKSSCHPTDRYQWKKIYTNNNFS